LVRLHRHNTNKRQVVKRTNIFKYQISMGFGITINRTGDVSFVHICIVRQGQVLSPALSPKLSSNKRVLEDANALFRNSLILLHVYTREYNCFLVGRIPFNAKKVKNQIGMILQKLHGPLYNPSGYLGDCPTLALRKWDNRGTIIPREELKKCRISYQSRI